MGPVSTTVTFLIQITPVCFNLRHWDRVRLKVRGSIPSKRCRVVIDPVIEPSAEPAANFRTLWIRSVAIHVRCEEPTLRLSPDANTHTYQDDHQYYKCQSYVYEEC